MLEQTLNDVITGSLFAFMLIFMRMGMALMIMPGIGDSFVPTQIRLLFALAFSVVLTPVLAPMLPKMPAETGDMVILVLSEMCIGIFLGTIMRILISALDTAGMMISMQSGLSNAQIFNPMTSTQGSIFGALYSMLGVTILLATNMHHYMLAAVVESYNTFPVALHMPDIGSMTDTIAQAVTSSFKIGIQISMPFIVIGLLIQIAFGLLGRLMPQIQVFFLAMPVQIGISLIMIGLVLSASMMFWLSAYKDLMVQYLVPN